MHYSHSYITRCYSPYPQLTDSIPPHFLYILSFKAGLGIPWWTPLRSIFVLMAHYAPSTSSRTVLPPIRTLLDSLEILEERPVLPSLDKIYGSQELDREVCSFKDSNILRALINVLCSIDCAYSHSKSNYLQPSETSGADDITNTIPYASLCILIVRPPERPQGIASTKSPTCTNIYRKRRCRRRDTSPTYRTPRVPSPASSSCGPCSAAFSSA